MQFENCTLIYIGETVYKINMINDAYTHVSPHTTPHVHTPLCHTYVPITHLPPHTQVGEREYPMDRMPGWEQNSCGYHADDGKHFHEDGMGTEFGPTCTDGDRMGCGVDFSTNHSSGYVSVFFTKNGKQVRRRRRRRDKKEEVEGR